MNGGGFIGASCGPSIGASGRRRGTIDGSGNGVTCGSCVGGCDLAGGTCVGGFSRFCGFSRPCGCGDLGAGSGSRTPNQRCGGCSSGGACDSRGGRGGCGGCGGCGCGCGG